jgi:hypothetical protein
MRELLKNTNRTFSTLLVILFLLVLIMLFVGPITGNYVLFQWGLILLSVGLVLTAINYVLMALYSTKENPIRTKTWRGVPTTIYRWEQLTTTPIALLSIAAWAALIALQEQLGLSNSQQLLINSILLLTLVYAVIGPMIIKGRIPLRYTAINGWAARLLGSILLVVITFVTVAYWGTRL